MANSIIIRFQPKGDKELLRSLKRLNQLQKELEGQVKATTRSTGLLSTSFDRNRKSGNALGNTFSTLRSKMLLFSFAVSMGGRQIAMFIEQSARFKGMETAFNTLTGATENSSIAIEKLKTATDGTMSGFDLFQQANNAMILGVSKNSSEMAEMFDIAQRLGEALGVDTKRAVESLITGIGRQSRLMLDNIGIIVKADEAYEDYAKGLGIMADDLTDAQKKQAFLNATMESARKKVSQLGAEQETPIKALNRLSAEFDNLKVSIGEAAGETFLPLIQVFTEFLRILQDLTPQIKTIMKLLSYFALGWGAVAIHARRAEKALIANKVAAQSLKGILTAAAASVHRLKVALASIGIGLLIEGVSRLVGWMSGANDEAEELEINVHNLNNASKSLRDTLISKGFEKYAEILNSAGSSVLSLGVAQGKIKGEMEAFNKRLTDAVPGWVIDRQKKMTENYAALAGVGKTVHKIEPLDPATQAMFNAYSDTYEEFMKEKLLLDEADAEIAKKLAEEKLRLGVLQETYLPKLKQETEVLRAKAKLDGPELEAKLKSLELEREGIAQGDIKVDLLKDEYIEQAKLIKKIEDKKATQKMEVGLFRSVSQAMKAGMNDHGRYSKSFDKMLSDMARAMASKAGSMAIQGFFSLAFPGLGLSNPFAGITGIGDFVGGLFKSIFHQGGQVQGYSTGGMIPGYATGGSIDNVPIMAQEGEYVLRRSAVDSIGLENLNRMNRTGQVSGGANITFTGNIMSDSFIEEEAIPKIKDAIRRGADLGIS